MLLSFQNLFCSKLGGKEYKEMHLQPDPLFVVATDNVYMTSVTGTVNGRIFLSGKDGCVYELTYQVTSYIFNFTIFIKM